MMPTGPSRHDMGMSRFPVVYDRARKPTNGPQPGARALMAFALARFPTSTNLGIYNVRSVRGGKALSTHAEGRGIDIGFPAVVGGTKEGWEAARLLRKHSADLGIQSIIYARRIWSNTKNKAGWRRYTGKAAHNEHIHVELTRQAAAQLTSVMIAETLGTEIAMAEDKLILPGNRKGTIREIQQVLKDAGHYTGKIDADPYLGTVAALHSLKNEGKTAKARVAQLESELAELQDEFEAFQERAAGTTGASLVDEVTTRKAKAFDALSASIRMMFEPPPAR